MARPLINVARSLLSLFPDSYPLLVLDMYEHAYHMDYGAAAAKYVDAFMQNANWDEVNRRIEDVRIRK